MIISVLLLSSTKRTLREGGMFCACEEDVGCTVAIDCAGWSAAGSNVECFNGRVDSEPDWETGGEGEAEAGALTSPASAR